MVRQDGGLDFTRGMRAARARLDGAPRDVTPRGVGFRLARGVGGDGMGGRVGRSELVSDDGRAHVQMRDENGSWAGMNRRMAGVGSGGGGGGGGGVGGGIDTGMGVGTNAAAAHSASLAQHRHGDVYGMRSASDMLPARKLAPGWTPAFGGSQFGRRASRKERSEMRQEGVDFAQIRGENWRAKQTAITEQNRIRAEQNKANADRAENARQFDTKIAEYQKDRDALTQQNQAQLAAEEKRREEEEARRKEEEAAAAAREQAAREERDKWLEQGINPVSGERLAPTLEAQEEAVRRTQEWADAREREKREQEEAERQKWREENWIKWRETGLARTKGSWVPSAEEMRELGIRDEEMAQFRQYVEEGKAPRRERVVKMLADESFRQNGEKPLSQKEFTRYGGDPNDYGRYLEAFKARQESHRGGVSVVPAAASR